MNPFSGLLKGKSNPGSPLAPEKRLLVTNTSRSTVLATRLEVADSGPKRNMGLLGRDAVSYTHLTYPARCYPQTR